jgi:hypothetical protein
MCVQVIKNQEQREIANLTKDNVVVVCGGANTIRKNELSKQLKYITQFVQNRINTNVVIMSAP